MMKALLFGAALLVAGCGERSKQLPASAGGQEEVLVVMPNGHWEGEPGGLV